MTSTNGSSVLRWLVAAAFVVILNETIMMNAIPRLMVDLRVDESAAQWLSTAFMLTMAVVIPITGWFLQRVTTRQAYALAMATFCVGTLLAAASWSFGVLVAARVVQASATAVMMPLLMTTLMRVVEPHDRGRVMGLVSLAMSVAPALGPAVSGVVLQFLGWRWIFLVVLPIALTIALVGSRRLGNVGETVSTPIDWLSAVLSAVGFGALVYGLSQMNHPSVMVAVLVVVGLLGVGAFVWRQLVLQRVDRPLLDLRTLRTRVYSVSLGAMAIAFGAMIGSMLLLQLYLQHARGMTPLATGLLVMPGGLAMGLLGPTIGRIYDRLGARVLMLPGGVASVLALAAFALMDSTTPYWMVLVAHVVLSLGLAALFTPMFTMSLGSLSSHLYSHGSSLLGATQQVAGALGTALAVVMLTSQAAAAAAQGAGGTAAYLIGLHWAFGLCAAAAVAMVGLVATLPARIEVDEPEAASAHV
ncbi:MAG TPA: DHA2 family efflux MFS transporter permease subunit [Propionibacteriaceae bacterium]|nr:DHA2 family efflux MFS transporter permease subunit [Propionibacteriaceae bacterium]